MFCFESGACLCPQRGFAGIGRAGVAGHKQSCQNCLFFFLTTFNVFLGPIVQAEPSKAPQMFSLEPREAATAKQIAFAVSSAFTICLHESFHCSAEV